LKYGGLEVSDARRLRVLEEENRKLKKLSDLRPLATVDVAIIWRISASYPNAPDR